MKNLNTPDYKTYCFVDTNDAEAQDNAEAPRERKIESLTNLPPRDRSGSNFRGHISRKSRARIHAGQAGIRPVRFDKSSQSIHEEGNKSNCDPSKKQQARPNPCDFSAAYPPKNCRRAYEQKSASQAAHSIICETPRYYLFPAACREEVTPRSNSQQRISAPLDLRTLPSAKAGSGTQPSPLRQPTNQTSTLPL